MITIILLALTGFASGLISGMGIGGGVILIPILSFGFAIEQHISQGVSLLYFLPTAIAALIIHFKNKKVELKTGLIVACFGIIGAVGGSLVAVRLSSGLLKKMFGWLLLIMGIYELWKSFKRVEPAPDSEQP